MYKTSFISFVCLQKYLFNITKYTLLSPECLKGRSEADNGVKLPSRHFHYKNTRIHETLARGPFLESPGKFSSPELHF